MGLFSMQERLIFAELAITLPWVHGGRTLKLISFRLSQR
jgi:hypothetical protein